jgi:four helix bundle protein
MKVNMKIERFEDILAWQKAKKLTKEIYTIFSDCRDFAFKEQLQRASVSVMNNIAEGFERKSNNELKYFLYISKGSCGEVRSMLILAFELKKIDEKEYNQLLNLAEEISKMLSGLIKTLKLFTF